MVDGFVLNLTLLESAQMMSFAGSTARKNIGWAAQFMSKNADIGN